MAYRLIELEILGGKNISSDLKLVIGEIMSWSRYYKQRGEAYLFNPARICSAIGINIQDVVLLVDELVNKGTVTIGESKGYNTIEMIDDAGEIAAKFK